MSYSSIAILKNLLVMALEKLLRKLGNRSVCCVINIVYSVAEYEGSTLANLVITISVKP